MPGIRRRTKEKGRPGGLHRTMLALTLLAGTAGLLLGGYAMQEPAAAEAEMMQKQKSGRTVMYVMDEAGLKLRDEDVDSLDQLNVSFALIQDGRANTDHWRGAKKLTSFLKKHPHVDGVLAVGGWGADGFSQACRTEEGRTLLAESILDVMDDHGLVGVDIDWEYPGISGTGIATHPDDVENWYGLLTQLRHGLDEREARYGREYILSVALGAGESHLNAIDASRLNDLVDQAVVMAYDLKGFDRTTGHHAGLYPDASQPNTGAYAVERLLSEGLDANKLLLGMPAYGRVWRQVTGGGDGLHQRAGTSGNKTISFDEVMALEEKGYTKHFDEAALAAYWFDGSSFVSAEDECSIREKCDWAVEKGLQGVAVWQYTQDASGGMLSILDDALSME